MTPEELKAKCIRHPASASIHFHKLVLQHSLRAADAAERFEARRVFVRAVTARLLRLMTMPYPLYLETHEWEQKRIQILARDKCTCRDCGRQTSYVINSHDIHHLTYERRGYEALADLIALCRDCHKRRHGEASP